MPINLTSIDHFQQLLQQNKYLFLLKHTQTSPISPNPYHQFNNFLYQTHIHPYYLILQQHPKLSHYIADKTNLKHESPQ
ncbi:monothiol bacilliredoxin BrxC family protein, partial [Staphylococcus epidermidis]|uniref:monothiol bacilliredoxin BrxC family protein n=1 Tax=Staphylococcus epidermidis TaxID=1282 RepID=UPI00119EF31D